MMSFFLVIMVALGCFVPSIDSTAGERERSTWETLMTVSAPRSSVILAKYLYVATLGILAVSRVVPEAHRPVLVHEDPQ